MASSLILIVSKHEQAYTYIMNVYTRFPASCAPTYFRLTARNSALSITPLGTKNKSESETMIVYIMKSRFS